MADFPKDYYKITTRQAAVDKWRSFGDDLDAAFRYVKYAPDAVQAIMMAHWNYDRHVAFSVLSHPDWRELMYKTRFYTVPDLEYEQIVRAQVQTILLQEAPQ